jgi:hypothetical protein
MVSMHIYWCRTGVERGNAAGRNFFPDWPEVVGNNKFVKYFGEMCK